MSLVNPNSFNPAADADSRCFPKLECRKVPDLAVVVKNGIEV